jgi:peroxiredoxin
LTFPILLDQRSEAARTYLVRGIPSTFFIDREGVIQAVHKGPLDQATIEALVASHLE